MCLCIHIYIYIHIYTNTYIYIYLYLSLSLYIYIYEIGVPKTIDNDVPLLDQTFGFDTACTEAERAVDSAYVEAYVYSHVSHLHKLYVLIYYF